MGCGTSTGSHIGQPKREFSAVQPTGCANNVVASSQSKRKGHSRVAPQPEDVRTFESVDPYLHGSFEQGAEEMPPLPCSVDLQLNQPEVPARAESDDSLSTFVSFDLYGYPDDHDGPRQPTRLSHMRHIENLNAFFLQQGIQRQS